MYKEEVPIIFNSDNVRAILHNIKKQTMRVVVPQPPVKAWPQKAKGWENGWMQFEAVKSLDGVDYQSKRFRCPYRVGQTLWVRETWAVHIVSHEKPSELHQPQKVWYRADQQLNQEGQGKWRPAIFMPRWASRITLKVISALITRLHDVDLDDLIDEGCPPEHHPENCYWMSHAVYGWFNHMWDSINAGRGFGYDKNPWVWQVKFHVSEVQP